MVLTGALVWADDDLVLSWILGFWCIVGMVVTVADVGCIPQIVVLAMVSTALFPISTIVFLFVAFLVHAVVAGETTRMGSSPMQGVSGSVR